VIRRVLLHNDDNGGGDYGGILAPFGGNDDKLLKIVYFLTDCVERRSYLFVRKLYPISGGKMATGDEPSGIGLYSLTLLRANYLISY